MSGFIEKLSKALGLNYVWWHWRWLRFKQRLKSRFSADTNTVRHLRSRQRICRCGALAGAGERTCGACGAKLPSAAANFLTKAFGLILPGVSPVTAGLISLIALDFIFQMVLSSGSALLKPSIEALLRSGALETQLVASGQWWRLLTSVFVHIGVIHLAFNLYALVSVSHFLEREIGSARYFCLFLLAGIGGSAASYMLRAEVVMAGASGALFGLIGFSISYFRRQGGARSQYIQTFMIRWAIYGFVFGLMMRADNIAHAGGFAAGFLLGSVMEFREDEKRKRAPAWKLMAGILLVALVVGFVLLMKAPPIRFL
jgi:rhomboid protease GluP